jgi:AraC-like DNA-binding protein
MNPTLVRDGMRYWRLQPDSRLRPWIVCYFLVEPDPAAAKASPIDERQLLIPDGHSELVFRLSAGFERWRVDEPGRRSLMCASYVIGGRSHSVLTRSIGTLRLAGVKLDPRALRALLGTPLGELRDTTLSFADLNCRKLSDLDDAVANVRSAASLAQMLDRFFLQELCNVSIDEPMIRPLLQQIRSTRGAQSVMHWAREHKVNVGTLERRFVAAMGITPKQYARIVRFKHSYHRLMSSAQPGHARVHLEGYYDESHFNREFKAFLGVAPHAWCGGAMPQRTSVSDHLLATELLQASE